MTSRTLDDLSVVRDALADDYDVVEELGRGGMAVVYRAWERALSRDVAIKVVPLARAGDDELIERFQREARTSAQLEHPNIVPIYRVGRRDPVIFFVMKLLRGQSLAERLERDGTLPADDVRRMLIQTGEALGYAARRGIVHRDIKPDNILCDDDGRYVLTDFGIARSMFDPRLTETGTAMGTPRYMSPEQARAKRTDGRSDIYSLGVVAYHCLIGRPPYDGDDGFAILLGHVQLPLPQPKLATVEECELFLVIERMLAKDPNDRFQNSAELIAALEETMPSGRPRPMASVSEDELDAAWDHARPLPNGSSNDDAAGESGPQPSPTLDAALGAAMELLRQQRPKLEAGLAAGRKLIETKAPRARAGATRAIDAGTRAMRVSARLVTRAGEAVAPMSKRGAEVVAAGSIRALELARARSRRFWIVAASVVVVAVAARYALHFATAHRSRCPAAVGNAANRQPWSILIDTIGAVRAGSDLDVYYDVCGLTSNEAFTTRITVVKNELGLKRFFGSSLVPVAVAYDDRANGAGERRHRSFNFDSMPTGTYTLGIAVTDAAGRKREKDLQFQVVER
jgi:serine/threonine protein kinase